MLNQRIMKDGGGVELEVCSVCKWLHEINGSGRAIAMHCTGATGFQPVVVPVKYQSHLVRGTGGVRRKG